jgi:hypothetical protein
MFFLLSFFVRVLKQNINTLWPSNFFESTVFFIQRIEYLDLNFNIKVLIKNRALFLFDLFGVTCLGSI